LFHKDTWIITAGTNEGIAKDVGQAVRENVSTLDAKKQIVLLGIANWTSIRNTHCLERGVDHYHNFNFFLFYLISIKIFINFKRIQMSQRIYFIMIILKMTVTMNKN